MLARFKRDERGSLLIFSIFLLIIMLMISGMAVDLMRTETQRARLQATLDRAVLAGASLEQTLDSKAVVLDYFQKAGLGSYISADNINVIQTPTSKKVNATAEMAVNTYFMNMLGITQLQAPAGGQAEESLTDVEVSLILDVSGSMAAPSASGTSKINVLKESAKEFVYLMQCDPDGVKPYDGNCVVEPNSISISMVPYNHQVMLGENLIEQFNVTQEHTNSSCVDFSPSDFQTIPVELDPTVIDPLALPDPTPSIKRSTQLDFWTGYGGSSRFGAVDQNRECAPNSGTDNQGRNFSDRSVKVFENNYLDLQNAIDNLFAGGNTSIDLAMKWGSAFLAPDFRPAVTNLANNYTGVIDPAFVGRPFNYNRPRTKKVVVLMTDGINTSRIWVKDKYRDGLSPFFVVDENHNAISPANAWDAATDRISVYSPWRDAAGYKPYRRINHNDWDWSPDGGSANAQRLTWPEVWERYQIMTVANAMDDAQYSDDRWWEFADYDYTSIKNQNLQAICSAAKDQGILIFTIGFETTSASSAVMSSCASSPAHNYDVDGLDLSQAFNSIAREIHELRLTN